MKSDKVFVAKIDGVTYVCNANGQKMIINDPKLLEMTDGELVQHLQSLNIFKNINERRC